MDTVTFISFVSLGVTYSVDFIRHFDKNDWVPKGIWLVVAGFLGIAAAHVACSMPSLMAWAGLPQKSCADQIVLGLGFGGSSALFHQLLAALSARSGPGTNQKGYWNTSGAS